MSIKLVHLGSKPSGSMEIEKNDMKLQYFPKCPLLIVKKQKHKIQVENHIKNLFFLKKKRK